jgi:hypothetical protein
MDQESNALGEGARDGDLGCVQQSNDVPPEVLGGPRRESGIEVSGDGEEGAHNIVGFELVGSNQRSQELVRGSEDLIRIVVVHGGGSPDSMDADWRGHGN